MKVSPAIPLEQEVAKPGENTILRLLGISQHIIKVKDIYLWEGQIFTILDYMDGRELTNVIREYG
jgi:serine/threonine protein kinase